VLLFCTVPLLISSLQLFLFGTYLPHRDRPGESNSHHARSLALPVWLSLLACFHFGYHWEHHEFPTMAWFQLPGMRAFPQPSSGQSSRLAPQASTR
jgi:beta-carotene ketolase (CrtW type)